MNGYFAPQPSCINPALIKALEYLRDHPDASAKSVANGIGESDDRYVFKMLDNSAYKGLCQRSKTSRGPWLWEICPDGLQMLGPDGEGR